MKVINTSKTPIYDQAGLILALQNFEESRFNRDFGEPELNKRYEKVDAYSVNLDFKKRLNKKNIINYGAEYVLNEVKSRGKTENIENGLEFDAQSRYPDGDWSSQCLYITSNHQIRSRWMTEFGMRYTLFDISTQFDTSLFSLPFNEANLSNNAISGSAGLLYELNTSTKINLNVSTGFRSPNIDDIGKIFDSEPGSLVVPNDNLEPEYVYNAEIGLNKIFHWFTVDLTAYYTILENALVRRDFTLNGMDSVDYQGELSKVQAIQNASESRIYGFNAGVKFNIGKVRITSKLNYQKGEDELEDGTISASRHVAPLFGSSHIIYRKGPLLFDLFANYSGEISYDDLAVEERGKPHLYAIDDNGNPYSPSWYTANIEVTADLDDDIQLTGGLYNITDQRYRTYSSGINAPGRNLVLTLRAAF